MSNALKPQTFMLVHGAWHGGWCWAQVADILRAHGHRVFTPTQTGLGAKKHLMSRDITLDVFVQDLVHELEFEDLHDVVLVGHSFGGIAISGAADRVPSRIRQLIYLDSLLLPGGMTPFSQLSPEVVAQRTAAAQSFDGGLSLPPPPPEAFGLLDHAHQAVIAQRLTPHPFGCYTSALHLQHELANGLPRTYVVCTNPIYPALAKSRELARSLGWPVVELATGHDAMVSAPQATAELFMQLASRSAP